jgi:hypothetical protein
VPGAHGILWIYFGRSRSGALARVLISCGCWMSTQTDNPLNPRRHRLVGIRHCQHDNNGELKDPRQGTSVNDVREEEAGLVRAQGSRPIDIIISPKVLTTFSVDPAMKTHIHIPRRCKYRHGSPARPQWQSSRTLPINVLSTRLLHRPSAPHRHTRVRTE